MMDRQLCPSLNQEIFPDHLPSARLLRALGDQSLEGTVVAALEVSAEGQCMGHVWSVICSLCLLVATVAHRIDHCVPTCQ